MIKRILFLLLFSSSVAGFSQPPLVLQLGSEPAYCRVSSAQNGYGVVYAYASGGVPGYSYQWTNLQTGATFNCTACGGLNPGDYEIKVWDNIGDSIVSVLTVDSLNVIADFNIVSNDLSLIGGNYIGWAPVNLVVENESMNFANPYNPLADTMFYWQFDLNGNSSWLHVDNLQPISHTYYGGEHTLCLVAVNKNGCSDTICKNVGVFGPPASLTELPGGGELNVYGNADYMQLTVTKANYPEPLHIRIYDISGKFLLQEELEYSFTSFSVNFSVGQYVFEVIDVSAQNVVGSGKFMFH